MALRSVRDSTKPVRDCCHDLDRDVLSYLVLAKGDVVVGRIDDIITDTRRSISRYMVVDTTFASFLVARKRILIPVTQANVDHQHRGVRVCLTNRLVEQAPRFERTARLDRNTEEFIHTFFGFVPYWALQDGEDGFGFARQQVHETPAESREMPASGLRTVPAR